MPLYEYECEKCHQTFEVLQSMHDSPIKKCEFCSGKVHRILSAPAIVFKGSGFHVNDYSRSAGGHPPAAKTDKPAPKSAEDSKSPPAPAQSSNGKTEKK